MLTSVQQWFVSIKNNWLDKRIPVSDEYRFDLNNTFILPTTFGWMLIGVMLLLFILGTNYQNNLVLLLSFFSLSIVLLSLFHSFYYFTRISIRFLKNDEIFANQTAFLNIKVTTQSEVMNSRLYYQHQYSQHVTNKDRRGRSKKSIIRTLTLAAESQEHQLIIGGLARGIHSLPRITFFSTYPFGLFKTWSHLAISSKLTIYPAPLAHRSIIKTSYSQKEAQGESYLYESSSSEELQGIREYKDEDPIYHVSWKHVAKGQGMLSKEFAAHQSKTLWLDINRINGPDTEQIINMLCYSVLNLSQNNQVFGLNLGHQQILPSSGADHRAQCLKALVLFNGIIRKPENNIESS